MRSNALRRIQDSGMRRRLRTSKKGEKKGEIADHGNFI
jgi:hypothetical protein